MIDASIAVCARWSARTRARRSRWLTSRGSPRAARSRIARASSVTSSGEAPAPGFTHDGAEERLERVAPLEDGVDVVAAVVEAGFVAADPLVAEQGDVEADLSDIGGPGAVREGVLAPAMIGGVGGGAVFGLDDDGVVLGELEHVEAAADPPGGRLEVEGAGDEALPGVKVGGYRGAAG